VNDYLPKEKRKFAVAYIPVTCHLACPVTDYISKFSEAGEIFLPKMFQGFPEIKEALISNKVQAAFIVAPLAIALKSQECQSKLFTWDIATAARWWCARTAQSRHPLT